MDLSYATDSISFHDPIMPDFLEFVDIRHLSLRDSSVDLKFHRHGQDVTLNLLSRRGAAKVMLAK
jgi:hypothetical protein